MAKVTLHATIFGEDGIKTRDYETALIPDAKNQEMQVINLYPDKTYQKIEGFGAALTESAGYALSRMSKENQKKVVDAYYGKDGIGYTIGRIHMDSCDFSVGATTAQLKIRTIRNSKTSIWNGMQNTYSRL